MMPTTPKGTRILLTLMPDGVGSRSLISPTGSGRSETTLRPEIIESILLLLSSNLSIRADPIDFCFANSKSSAFTFSICFLFDSISSAMQPRASFFFSKEACARTIEASFASEPNFLI